MRRLTNGANATLVPTARRYVALDIDSLPCPDGIDPVRDTDAVVEFVVSKMPAEFKDVTCHWALTGNAGIKSGIRLRLWFWLCRPVEDRELGEWFRGYPVDHSVFKPAQEIYTAAPIFKGMSDPVPRRSGLWRGERDEVTPPAIITKTQRAYTGTGGGAGGGGYEHHTARIGDHEGGDGFLAPIKSAVASWWAEKGAGADPTWLRTNLETVIRAAKRDTKKHPDSYIETRVADLDLLIEAIRTMQAESEARRYGPISPAPDPNAPTADEVRRQVEGWVKTFGDELLEYNRNIIEYNFIKADLEQSGREIDIPPPQPSQMGIITAPAIGKSHLVRRVLAEISKKHFPGRPLVVLTPTLDLAEEAAEKGRAHGLIAAVIRGRDADQASGDGKMCLDPEAAKDAWGVGENVQSTVCKRTERGEETVYCQHYAYCPYQLQRIDAGVANIIYMPHQHLFQEKPEVIGDLIALVIDESFHQAGVNTNRDVITCDHLARSRDVLDASGDVDSSKTLQLLDLNRRLRRAIARCDGPLTAEALSVEGVFEDNATEARRLWYATLRPSGIRPGMPAEERRKLRERVEENNKAARRYASLWRIVRDFINSGETSTTWLRCQTIKTNDGDTPGCYMTFRKEIRKGWMVPTLLLDATMREELVRPFFPRITIFEAPYPQTPHAEIVQVRGAPVTEQKLSDSKKRRGKDLTTAKYHLSELAHYIEIRARQFRKLLVITQQEFEVSLREIGLPANVETAHFNNVRGIDRWRNVDYVLVIGRTLPAPGAAEVPAEALTGRVVTPLLPEPPRPTAWYPKREGGSEYHPDPTAEAVRWGICEAELVQVIGRARAINRTADNPVLVEVMCDVSLPLPVNRTVRWSAPTRFEVMVARGVVLENLRDRARCFPDLWGTEQAAKNDNLRTVAKDSPANNRFTLVCWVI
ncbi:MAG: hypothetical protein WCJ64_05315, partial [Rhodospirillaceae bacterium]